MTVKPGERSDASENTRSGIWAGLPASPWSVEANIFWLDRAGVQTKKAESGMTLPSVLRSYVKNI
jgi:hypothetical protein